MAAGGRRQRWCYGTRNWSQGQGGGFEDSGRVQEEGRIVCLLLLVVLLPGAPPFVSFLSSSPEAEEEGKGGREIGCRDARVPGRCGGDSNLTTRVEDAGGGGRVVRGEERMRMRCRRTTHLQEIRPRFSYSF
jgi:alkylation response protein AidB-like acyl-CoA dehydrogenase